MGIPITTIAQMLAKADGGYGIRVRNTSETRYLAIREPLTSREVVIPFGTPGAWVEIGEWLTAPEAAACYELREWLKNGWIDCEATNVFLALSPGASHGLEVVCDYTDTNPARFALDGASRGFRVVSVTGTGVQIKTHGATAGVAGDYRLPVEAGMEFPYFGLDFLDVYFGSAPAAGDTLVISCYRVGDPAQE
jgi:hypothetical protein